MKKSSMEASLDTTGRKLSKGSLYLVFGLAMAIIVLNIASYFLS